MLRFGARLDRFRSPFPPAFATAAAAILRDFVTVVYIFLPGLSTFFYFRDFLCDPASTRPDLSR